MAQTNFTALLGDAAQKGIKETKKTTNNFQSLMSDSEDKKEKTSINDIAASLEGTDDNRFLSKGWFKNAGKVTGHWLDNAWHTITDRDTKNGIYDYSQFKEYNKQLKAAEASGETVDRDLFYQSMAKDGIIDYDKFKENYKEYEGQYDKYKKALENNKEDFSNKLKDSLSTAMSNAEGSYEINTLTKAIDKMVNQRQMFVDSVMTTYKDTRDKSLVDYMNETIDDYDNAIITFTKEWADHLTRESMKGGGAYYATIKDDEMKDLANTIVRIQNKAQNKMTSAAVADNFADSWESFTHGNFISAAGELVGAAMNGMNWILNKAGNIIEEGKQITGGMYDVVEELNHLNTYADDASGFRKAFGSLGSWTMSIIDAIPELGPAVVDLFVGEKVGTLSKAAKAVKNADKAIDAVKQASLIDKIISKGKYKDFIKIGTEKGIQYLDEVTKDILVYDVAFQQFEGHPLTTDEMSLNLLFNLPLDYLSIAFNQGAKYFKPNLDFHILKDGFISRELLNQLKKGIEKGYSDKRLAEIYYIGKGLEKVNPSKHMINIEEGLNSGQKDLFNKIQGIQEDSVGIRERLTQFEGDMDDMVAEMTRRVSNRELKGMSVEEGLVMLENELLNKTNLGRIFQTNITARTNVGFIGRLIDGLRPTNPDIPVNVDEVKRFSKMLKNATEKAAGEKNKSLGRAIYGLFMGSDGDIIAGLAKQGVAGEADVAQILQDTVKELIRQDRTLLTKNPNTVVNGWWFESDNMTRHNIYTGEKKQMLSGPNVNEEQRTEDMIKFIFGDELKIQSIEADKIELGLEKALLTPKNEEGLLDVTNAFQSEYLNPSRFGNVANDLEGKEITNLFKNLGLDLRYDGQTIHIMGSEERITEIQKQMSRVRQGITSIAGMSSDIPVIAKILYIDEYIKAYSARNKTLKDLLVTDTQTSKLEFEMPIDRFEADHSKKYRKNKNQHLPVKDKGGTDIQLKEQLTEENDKAAAKNYQDMLNGKKNLTEGNVDAASIQLKNSLEIVIGPDGKELPRERKVAREKAKAFLDASLLAAKKNLEDVTKEETKKGTKKFVGGIDTFRDANIQNIEESKDLLSDTIMGYLETFKGDNFNALFRIATQVVGIILQSPSAIDALVKNLDISFFKTIFARVLLDDKEAGGRAAYAYLQQGQKMYDSAVTLLQTTDEKLLYNNGFKELGECIEKGIIAAKKESIDDVTRNNLNIAFKNIGEKTNDAKIDIGLGNALLKKFNPEEFKGKHDFIISPGTHFNISDLNDDNISDIAEYLAKAQLEHIGVPSKKLYDKLYNGFYKGLSYVKTNTTPSKRVTFTITKGEFGYLINSKDTELGVLQINNILGNIDNADFLSNVAILHEMGHLKSFEYYGEAVRKEEKAINKYIKDEEKKGGELEHRLARLEIKNEELEKIGGRVSDYILGLKKMLREGLLKMKPGQLNPLYNTTQTIVNKQEYYDLLDKLDISKVVEKLSGIADRVFEEENYGFLYRNNMIEEMLLNIPEFNKIDEIITEAYSMSIAIGEGYKGINAYELNLVLDKAYEAAQLIDKFRCIFYDTSVKDSDTVKELLSVQTNPYDLNKLPTSAQLIEDKIFSNIWDLGGNTKDKIYTTPNEFVNDLLSRGTNKKPTLADIKNHKVKLPEGRKLVFFDLETTRLKEKTVNGVYKDPEILQIAVKEYENVNGELVEHKVRSNYFFPSDEGRREYTQKTVPGMKDEWRKEHGTLIGYNKDIEKEVEMYGKKDGGKTLQGELDYLKQLNEDENVIFVLQNGLQFDLPIIRNLGVNISEDKCIDTLQIYKAVEPFGGTWKQEEMYKQIKGLEDAMKMFKEEIEKEKGIEMKSHNAEYDTQELYHIFGYLYEHLRKNNKIKENATPEEILQGMKEITVKMQHTPKGQYITKSMKGKSENYTIERGKDRAIGLAGMMADAIKISSEFNEGKTTKQLADSIKKGIREYIDGIDGTELRGVVDKVQLEDMLDTLKELDDEEVVAFGQMLDSVKPYVPNISELKPEKGKVRKNEIGDFYDNIDIRSVEGELPEVSDKRLFDIKSIVQRNSERKQDNVKIANRLLTMDRYGTVNVAKTLSTMKGKLGEVGDAYLNRLIRIANENNLEIDAKKLLVGDETISRFKTAKKNGYKGDFNMFVINRLYYNVLSLKPELLKEIDIVNDTNTFNILDAIRVRLTRGEWNGENVVTKDTKILEGVIDGINRNITEKITEGGELIDLPAKEILDSFTGPEIEDFNNSIVRYIDAYKKGDVEGIGRYEYIILNSIISKVGNEYMSMGVDKMLVKNADLSGKNGIKDMNKKSRWKVVDKLDDTLNSVKTLKYIIKMLSDKVGFEIGKDNPDIIIRQMIADAPDDMMYLGEEFDAMLLRIYGNKKEFKKAEIDEFLQNWGQVVLSQIYKKRVYGGGKRVVPQSTVEKVKELINSTDIYKMLNDDYKNLKRWNDMSEEQYEDFMTRGVGTQELDTGFFDTDELKWKEGEAKETSIIRKKPKLHDSGTRDDDIPEYVTDKDGNIVYEYYIDPDFGSQLKFGLEEVLDTFVDEYKLYKNIDCNTIDSISETSKGLTINQGVFYNKALPNNKELEELFNGNKKVDVIATNKFSLYNKGIYGKGLVDNVNSFGVNSIGENSKLNVVFSDGTKLTFRAGRNGGKPIVSSNGASDLELLLSAIKSITTKRGTMAMLINGQEKAMTENIYGPVFWNSFAGKYIAQKFGFYDRIALDYEKMFDGKQIDDIYSEIQSRGLDSTIEGKPVLQSIYDLVITPRKETYQYPDVDKLERLKEKGEGYEEEIKRIKDEFKKNYPLIKELEDRIISSLKGSEYDIVKQYKTDLEKLKELHFTLNTRQDSNVVRIIDKKNNEVIKTIDNPDDTFEVVIDDYRREIPFGRIGYNYSERDYITGEKVEKYSRWNKGNRDIYVEFDNEKQGYRIVEEKETKGEWSIYMVQPKFIETTEPSPYSWDSGIRNGEYGYGPKEEEYKKKADEIHNGEKDWIPDWDKYDNYKIHEGKWIYIEDLLDEKHGISDIEGGVFDQKRWLDTEDKEFWGDMAAKEFALVHDGTYNVKIINEKTNEIREAKVVRAYNYLPNGDAIPAYKMQFDITPEVPDKEAITKQKLSKEDISNIDDLVKEMEERLKIKFEMKRFHKRFVSGYEYIDNPDDYKLIPEEWLKEHHYKVEKELSKGEIIPDKGSIVNKYYSSLEEKLLPKEEEEVSHVAHWDMTDEEKEALEDYLIDNDVFPSSNFPKYKDEKIKAKTKELFENGTLKINEEGNIVFDESNDNIFEIGFTYSARDGGRNQNILTKELETDEAGGATMGKSEKDGIRDYNEFSNIGEWRIKLTEDRKEYDKILKQESLGRHKSLMDALYYKQNFVDNEDTYKRYYTGNGNSPRDEEYKQLKKDAEIASKMGDEENAKAITRQRDEVAMVNKVLNGDVNGEKKQMGWLSQKISGLTNKSLIRDDETIRQMVGERDAFMQLNEDKLYDIADRWNDLMDKLDNDDKVKIFDRIRSRVNASRNKNEPHTLLIDLTDINEEADAIINEFAKIMNFNGNWQNTEILGLVNSPMAINNIIGKLNTGYSIVGMGKMGWTRNQTFEYAMTTARLNGIEDRKQLINIGRDFVGDPLGVGAWQNALANLRSVNRFLKYSVPSPIGGTVMLLNGTLLGEQMYRAKKKGLNSFMSNSAFEKICLNENVLKIFSRGEDIVLHGNTDMDINMIAFDKALKGFADAFTKEGTKARQVAETIMLGGIHSLQDLTYSGKVRVLAFAQALQQKGITELQLDDMLKKIESGEMWTNKEYLTVWNDIMARTEYFYDDFFTNSATAFMSRNKYSRLFIFNNLQGYVIKRTDEIGRAITGFKNWLAAKPQGVSYTWGDFVDHLEQNQELKAFLNNVILSTKLAYYFNRTDKIDGGEGNNIGRYMIEANDYLSSIPATFFYQLLTSPISGYNKYSEWADITGEDKNLADGTSVVLMNVLSQVCSQFFREGKPLSAFMDAAVSFAKTGDLGFAATVMGTDLEKIANGLGRFGLIDGLEKYGLEDFSADHDIIGQILLAGDKTSEIGKSIQDSYDVSFVDNILNDKDYAFVSALGNLPLIGEFIKSVSDKGGYTFNEAKVKELADMMDNDKNLQNIMYGKFDYSVFKDHPDAIDRIYSDFVSFNYTNETLKSPGKHAVGYFIDGKDTTLDSMKEDVFVKNICDKLGLTIEQFHYNITQGYRDDYNVKDRSARTVGILKMLAAADASEPGSGKIILSYMVANRLYELEKETTGLKNPKTADIPEEMLTMLKAEVINEFASEMYTADRTSQYKVMREYISIANPEIFKTLYNDNTLKGYANSIGFLDMLTYQAAKDGDVNAKYFKNVFSLTSKYMKDDVNRLALMRHVMSTIDETDLDTSAKMIAKEGVLAGNIDVYNRCKENPYFRAMHPGVMEDFEHRIWGIWDYLNIAGSDYSGNGYKKGYTNYSKYNDGNQQVHDDLVKQLTPYTNPFSPQYIPRQGTRYINTPKGVATSKGYFNWQLKYYEGLIKTYSDRLVKSTGKKYPAEGTEKITFKTGSNNRGAIRGKQLNFPKHKSKDYRTKLFSNLPGSHG